MTFDLVEAPAGHAEVFWQVVNGSAYPWGRIKSTVTVLWRPLSMQLTGQWWSGGNRAEGYPRRSLVLNANMRDKAVPFTVAHELGHVIDSLTLRNDDRQALTELMHTVTPQLGHYNHDHPDAGHHTEDWRSHDNAYPSRLTEAFADLFVRAFCPEQWEGHWPRFVHWADDLDTFRHLVLGDTITTAATEDTMGRFTDVSDTATHAEAIEWAAEQGLIEGFPDGTFRSGEPVTRGQLATILRRALA